MISLEESFNWDISCPGLVLSYIGNFFLISICSLIGDDGDISCLCGDNSSVTSIVDSVVPSFLLSSVLSLVLNSVVGVENGVIPGLLIFSVEDLVFVGVPGLWFISIFGLRVGSCEDLNLSSVSVFFLLPVVDFVVSLVSGEWSIFVVSFSVVSIDGSWFPGESSVFVGSVLDLISGSVSDFLFWCVLDLDLGEFGGDWNLACSDFSLSLGLDGVLDLVVGDFDVSELGLFTVFDVSVFPGLGFPLDGGDGCDECYSEFHCIGVV